MIALKNVAVGNVLKDVSLAIRPKECVCITGDKPDALSALFRVLSTTLKPDAGSMEVDNVDTSALPKPVLQLFRSRLGLVFHPALAIDHLTVGQNVALPLHLRGLAPSVITAAADDLLKRCGLAQRVSALPKDLTEEETQMMCVARCVIGAPLVIVGQDPFHALSEKNAQAAATLFQNLRKKGATIIFLSRDARAADLMGVAPVVIENGTLHQTVMEKPAYVPEKNDLSAVFTPPAPVQDRVEEEIPVRVQQEPAQQRQAPTEKKAGKIHITSIGSGLS